MSLPSFTLQWFRITFKVKSKFYLLYEWPAACSLLPILATPLFPALGPCNYSIWKDSFFFFFPPGFLCGWFHSLTSLLVIEFGAYGCKGEQVKIKLNTL